MDRRTFITTTATIPIPLIAGCTGGESGTTSPTESPTQSPTPAEPSTPTDTPTPTATPTASPTPTETPTPSPTPTPTAAESARVEATGANEFKPTRVSIQPGGTVTWENTTAGAYDSHTVTSAQFHDKAKQWSMDKTFSGGQTISHTFEQQGVYEYYCTIHGKSTMCGAVLVGDVTLDKKLPCE